MVHAYHLIFGAYGFWLPNDPRGSWSVAVRRWEIFLAGGKATKIETRRSVASRPHDTALRRKTKDAMQYLPVRFSGLQARAIGRGFAKVVLEYGRRIHACSILPEHVHLVLGRTEIDIRQVVRQLKQQATLRLREENLCPPGDSPWSRGSWTVFLNNDEAVRRAVEYVESNPLKEGNPPQRWSFVTPYEASGRSVIDR